MIGLSQTYARKIHILGAKPKAEFPEYRISLKRPELRYRVIEEQRSTGKIALANQVDTFLASCGIKRGTDAHLKATSGVPFQAGASTLRFVRIELSDRYDQSWIEANNLTWVAPLI